MWRLGNGVMSNDVMWLLERSRMCREGRGCAKGLSRFSTLLPPIALSASISVKPS